MLWSNLDVFSAYSNKLYLTTGTFANQVEGTCIAALNCDPRGTNSCKSPLTNAHRVIGGPNKDLEAKVIRLNIGFKRKIKKTS